MLRVNVRFNKWFFKKSISIHFSFSNNSVFMGSGSKNIRSGHQQHHSGGPALLPVFNNYCIDIIQRSVPMGEAKIILWILTGVGLPAYVWAIFLNINNYKADILFFIGGSFVLIRIFFFILRQLHLYEMRKLELKEKKHNVNQLLDNNKTE